VSAEGLAILVLPAVVAAAVIGWARGSWPARTLVDRPNERSLHATPTPRVGGIGLMAGALPLAAWFAGGRYGAALACALALALLSALDDWRSLPVQVRLPAHAVAALVALLALGAPGSVLIALNAWALLAAIAAIVWMTNLYNFMDGADGLAGLMAVIGFGALALAAHQAGATELAAACAALASAAVGFLAFNFPPARVFMGDAGSIPLGFLAAVLGGHGALSGAWPWWYPVLVFSPFIVDATVTILKRLVRGERIWIAHRGHYYQRLVLSGWSPRTLALAAAALMLAAAAAATVALGSSELVQCGILVGCSVAYAILVGFGEAMTKNNT
jgi:UDP-N-acetylmuramyl pentapeptide phosphotransferase/UDP-N-acetylglucosamine-1-phosphate transferase